MPARSGPAWLCRGWPRDPCAALLAGTPCHPDPHLPGLTHHCSRSSAPAPVLSTQGTPSPLLPPGPALLQKHPPSCLCRERGRSLARPTRGLCTGTWQPGALSVPSTRLALLRRQRGVPGPSRGTAVPLLGQLVCGARPSERYELPCSATCSLMARHRLPSLGATPVQGSGEHSSVSRRSCGRVELCSGPCRWPVADAVGKGRGEGWRFATSPGQAVPWDQSEAAPWVPSLVLCILCPGRPGILVTCPSVLPAWRRAPSFSPFVFAGCP